MAPGGLFCWLSQPVLVADLPEHLQQRRSKTYTTKGHGAKTPQSHWERQRKNDIIRSGRYSQKPPRTFLTLRHTSHVPLRCYYPVSNLGYLLRPANAGFARPPVVKTNAANPSSRAPVADNTACSRSSMTALPPRLPQWLTGPSRCSQDSGTLVSRMWGLAGATACVRCRSR